MKLIIREPISVAILIVLLVCSDIKSVESSVIGSNDNRNNNRPTFDDKSNIILPDSMGESNYRQMLKEISEKEKGFEELVLRFPELRSVLPFLKLRGYQSDRRTSSTNSTRCGTDLENLVSSLSEKWIWPLIDSYGKPGSGILRGNVFWTGNYDECRKFEAPKTNLFPSGFKGRFCVASIASENSSLSIQTAICVPDSCDSADLNNLADLYIVSYLSKIPIVKNYVKDLPEIQIQVDCVPDSTPLNTSSIVFIILVSVVTSLVLIGSGFDAYLRYYPCSRAVSEHCKSTEDLTNDEPSFANTSNIWIREFLMCFSALKNGASLLDTSVKPGQLNCVHGIRVISISWVVLGHTYAIKVGIFANIPDIADQLNNWPFFTVLGGKFSVDTFFLLSGFLLTYLFLKDKNTFTLKKLGVFYTHRFVRLTPVYMMSVFGMASLFNFVGDGPIWSYKDRESNFCTKFWWRNLLYINNLFPNSEACLLWSWYLANDMQFYIISPLFLVFMKSVSRKWRNVGLSILLAILLTSWISTIGIVVANDITAEVNAITLTTGETITKLYYRPWSRIGPYLIGCLLGYVIVEFKDYRSILLTKYWNMVWWCVAISLGLANVYGTYQVRFGLAKSAAYLSLSHSAWAVGVSWVIFSCLTGRADPVDKFLSWKFFFPLSRLTYCTYLLHPVILTYYFTTLRTPVMYSGTFVAVHYLGFLVLSYGAAFLTSLALESPIIGLEKLLRQGVKP